MKAKIVVADDEPRIRAMIALLLKEDGYEVQTAANGQEAVDALLSFRPDVILLDQQMPVLTGVEALEKIKRLCPNQVVVFITAFGSVSLAVDAVKKGAYDFIEKPFDNDKLLLTVSRAVEHCRMKGEIKYLKNKLGDMNTGIIGEKSGLRQVMLQVERVAETDATVLIHGESGTGKELIAWAIHDRSKRVSQPFVAINCGAIPLTLMESELFGHEKGAFTDAKETQAGTFERANGGTLFLDEIGELPLDAQVKLLRVLEERKITRIGGKKAIPVNVRIVAATNRNLEEEVRLGKFREDTDLLYRLNVFHRPASPLKNGKWTSVAGRISIRERPISRLNLCDQSITRAMEIMHTTGPVILPGFRRTPYKRHNALRRPANPSRTSAAVSKRYGYRSTASQGSGRTTSLRGFRTRPERRILSALPAPPLHGKRT